MAKRRSKACKCLPSGDAAQQLIADPSLSTAGMALGTMALRGVLVAAGLYVAGARGTQLLGYTAGAVVGIEAGVLAWAVYKS